MPSPTPAAPADEAPIETPTAETPAPEAPVAEEPKSQEEIEALVDETLKEYFPQKPKSEEAPKEPEQPETPPEEPEEPETPDEEEEPQLPEDEEEPEQPVEQPDPEGLFIEVEDAAGNKYKITQESDLPEDFVPKNNRQVIEILRQLDKLDAEKANQAASEEQKAQEAAAEQHKQEVLTGWDNEIQSLIDAGIVEAPKAKPGTKMWESDPAVQKLDGVFKFMVEQNTARSQAGKPPLTSFAEAYMLKDAIDAKAQTEAKIKEDNAAAKAKAGLIGRNSAPASKGNEVYAAGQARSMDDIVI